MGNLKKIMIKYSICVSGAASGESVEESCGLAYELGLHIAKAGHVLTTGATVGLPLYAARGAKDAEGMSIGFSPAASLRDHIRRYRLPVGYFDYINFTGMNYIGRDIHLILSSEAVITVGGRIGSLHEFTTALEAHLPCGVLLGSGGLADTIPELIKELEIPKGSNVIFDTDPERLVKRIVDILDKENADIDLDAIEKQWAVKSSICEPLAGKHGFSHGNASGGHSG